MYKKRFKANEARRKAGLAELTPGTYIALEDQYRKLMQEAMLPAGFYDNPEDFTGLIEAGRCTDRGAEACHPGGNSQQ